MRYLLNYAPDGEATGRPWGLTRPDGECRYFAAVCFRVPTRTVYVPGPPRRRGFLEAVGALQVDGDTAVIVEEPDDET